MAYVMVHGHCYGCRRMFGFNPNWVPSLTINGVKEPFCKDCIDQANPKRIANGLDPIVPHPLAYEPCEESELG